MRAAFSVLVIFVKTFHYYFLSHLPGARVRELKQSWASSIMHDFGYEVSVSGVPPGTGPLILVGNHISYLDIMLLMSVHPDIVFIAKREVSMWPVIGVAAARVGTIFIDREAKQDGGKKRSLIAEALKKDNSHVVVFPSGTTSLQETKLWKKGIFEIAKENSIQVKAFKIHYSPLRESAYIDEDNLLDQMQKLFSLKNKTAKLEWLAQHDVISPIESAEMLRLSVLEFA